MKKLLSIGFVLIMAIGLTACEKPEFLGKKEVPKVVVKENPVKNLKKDLVDKKEEKIIEKEETEGKEENKTEDKKSEKEKFMEFLKKEIKKCEKTGGEWNKMSKTCNNKNIEKTTEEQEDVEEEAREAKEDAEEEAREAKEDAEEEAREAKEDAEEEAREAKEDAEEEAREERGGMISQQTLLILDASGSMWGQIEGKAKIEIAKEVVKKTVKNFENTELGLMAYGHRRKGDCEDIEILTSPKKDNAKNISEMVNDISPKGMTPMGASVMMAAESLKYTEQKATVILVSDGIETCEVDLCELGKKLEKTGVDFTAHVIGFDMTEEQTAGLKCLASETGGTFTSAKNADDLGKALEKTVEAASCSKEKLGEAIITAPKTINAGSNFEIEYTGPKNSSDLVAIVPKGSTNSNDHISYLYPEDNDTGLTAPVEVGEYDIVYFANCGADLGRTTILVAEVSATITAPETVNAGSNFEIEYTGPQNSGDFIALVPKGSTNSNDHISYLYPKDKDTGLTAPVEAGDYDIVYWAGRDKILAKTTLRVLEVFATITAPETVNSGSNFEIEYTGPKNSGDFIALVPKGSTNSNDHISYLYPEDNDTGLTAPVEAGDYDIVYWAGRDKVLARTTLTVIK